MNKPTLNAQYFTRYMQINSRFSMEFFYLHHFKVYIFFGFLLCLWWKVWFSIVRFDLVGFDIETLDKIQFDATYSNSMISTECFFLTKTKKKSGDNPICALSCDNDYITTQFWSFSMQSLYFKVEKKPFFLSSPKNKYKCKIIIFF